METPALDHFLTYFHQDFYLDHGGMWQTVDAFGRDEPTLLEQLPREIEARLAEAPTEGELRNYVRAMGCEYRLQPEDGDYRTWLTAIAQRVEVRGPLAYISAARAISSRGMPVIFSATSSVYGRTESRTFSKSMVRPAMNSRFSRPRARMWFSMPL